MILHVDYYDKRTGTEERVSFVIKEYEDYKPIVKGLRSKRLKITQIMVEIRYETKEKIK